MKELFNYVMSTKVQLGLRLVLATMLLLTGQLGWAMIALLAPVFTPLSPLLCLSAAEIEQHQALVTALKGEITTEVASQVKALNPEGETRFNAIVEKKLEVYKDLDVAKLKDIVAGYEEMNKTVADMKAKSGTRMVSRKQKLLQKCIEDNWQAIQDNFINRKSSTYGFKLEKKVTSAAFGSRVIFGFREAGIDFDVLPETFILDLIQVMSGGPGSNPLSWIERTLVTGAAAPPFPAFVAAPTVVAEAAVKPSLNFAWSERIMPAVTIAALVPVTKQAVFNYPLLEQEIRYELMRRVLLVLQAQILKGTGTGGQMTGLFTYAQTLVTTDFIDSVDNANEYDVLVAAATQVLNNNFIPTTALVTHTSKARMSMAKDTTGGYVLPPFSSSNGLEVYGLKLYSTSVLVGDEFLVMDPKRALFNWVENPTIEIGLINDDFERNIWRIRCELQGMLRVKEHERGAFVKGDFSLAMADMEKP